MSATLKPVRLPERRNALAARGEVVLVVDDDPGFRSIVVTRLDRAGVLLYEAGSVSEAIETLENRHVDLVVCDYCMPEGKGTVLLAYLTQRGFVGRFVLTSASLPPGVAAEARSRGAQAIEKWHLLDYL